MKNVNVTHGGGGDVKVTDKSIRIKIGGIIIIVGVLLAIGVFFLMSDFGGGGTRGGMPQGRFYLDGGLDEMMAQVGLPPLMVYEFRGRGEGALHSSGVSVTFEYRIQGDRLLITEGGTTLEYILGENRESFSDSSGLQRFAMRQ
jgi:hypothetical protein